MTFRNPEESHAHSLTTLNLLYQYSDFMESIGTVVDLGCGSGLDTEWWATRTTNDDNPVPLNINCIAVDKLHKMPAAKKYQNVQYQQADFENGIQPYPNKKFDVLWCHDAFQYAVNPLATLAHWWSIANNGAMLAIVVPQTTTVKSKKYVFTQESGCYYHHTMISLIHMLAVTGWDCKSGFFKKSIDDNWLHAVVYKSNHAPLDYHTSWYQLSDLKLLPESADVCIKSYGELRQQELILPWLDKSLMHLGLQ